MILSKDVTVKKLIEILKKQDQNANISYYANDEIVFRVSEIKTDKIMKFIEHIKNKDPKDGAPFGYGEWYDGWSDAIKWVSSELKDYFK